MYNGYPAYSNYPPYSGYGAYGGGYGPPGPMGPILPYQGLPAPQVVRHTLERRSWVWVVVATALVAALVGGLVGATVGANSQQTIIEKFFPNTSALTKPQDIQEVLAKVEPAVVAIDSDGSGSSGGGTSWSRPGAG